MSPHAHRLSKRTRTLTFFFLVLVFFVSTPIVWLYASGYRFVYKGADAGTATSTSAIRQTGGLFIGVAAGDAIFVDDALERGSRLFSNARYIDGVSAGVHRVHVQHEGAHTWVKVLTVDPQYVTEAYAFNLPLETSVRLIAPVVDTTETPLLRASSTLAAQIVNEYRVHPTVRGYKNEEYAALSLLFEEQGLPAATTTASTTVLRAKERVEALRNAVEGIVPIEEDDVLLTRGDIDIIRRGADIIARYSGSFAKMPYYFCVDQASTTPCVPEIHIDRQEHTVRDVAFYPSTDFDALILTRDDAVVVTELDPRGGWQNTQPLLEGENLSVKVQDTHIYVSDGDAYYELVLE